MVLLTVKGTKHADEFTMECSTKDTAGAIAPKAAEIQNKRLSVRNQLSSAEELLPSARKAVAMEGRSESDASLAGQLEQQARAIREEIQSARLVVPGERYSRHWDSLRDLTAAIFPSECKHADDKDGSHEAAITQLYSLYENPDIDEDYRLLVYHCRCMMDPLWRIHDMVDTNKTVALWFNGKEVGKDTAIGTLCANNEKSRITVKVALSGGTAPSLEPRISYDQQREMRMAFAAKSEERRLLEESEMHELIKKQRSSNHGAVFGAIARASAIAPSDMKGCRPADASVETM